MKNIDLVYALALMTALGACAQSGTSADNESDPLATTETAAHTEQVYLATGEVTAIAGDRITIAHGPVAEIEWPPMTMGFGASEDMISSVNVGDSVSFSFQDNGGDYALTSITRLP